MPNYPKLHPDMQNCSYWIAQAIHAIRTKDHALATHKFLLGDTLCLADVAFYMELSLLVRITKHSDEGWIEHFGNIN